MDAVDSTKNKEQKTPSLNPDSFIDTEFKFTDSEGKNVIIQNSFPRGGGDIDGIRGYYSPTGTHYGYGLFWTRIINETTSPIELAINSIADSLTVSSPSSDNYFKLFLPPNDMTVDKITLTNYGATGLKSFLDTNYHNPTTLHKTIDPNQDFMFLVGLLVHVPDQRGTIRAGIVLEEQDLFYRVSIEPLGTKLIPFGQFVLRKSKE